MDYKSVRPRGDSHDIMPFDGDGDMEGDGDGDDEGFEGEVVAAGGEPMGTVGKAWDWKERMWF